MAAPIFVPRQDSISVYDGWLVGQVWGPHQPHMEIWIWDASSPLHLGPICKLGPSPGERGLRPGFPLHSCWLDSEGVEHWQSADYKVPIIEVPTYLKFFELGNMASGFISRLVQQSLSTTTNPTPQRVAASANRVSSVANGNPNRSANSK